MKPCTAARRHCHGSNEAYTMVEVLVVITLIGVLVGLLLPAVNAAREAARRGACVSLLSQLMVAVHQYESAFMCYPPGTLQDKGPILSQPKGYHHSWISQILPYLEQSNAYRHIDRQVGVYHPINLPVRRVEIPAVRCPSTPAGRGYSDYAGIHDSREVPIDVDNNGVFYLNSRVRYSDVLDGLSNTLFIGEKNTPAGDLGWVSGTRSTLRNMGVPPGGGFTVPARTPPPGVAEVETQQVLEGEVLLNVLFGSAGKSPWDTAGNTFVRPNNALVAVGGFGSPHPGVTNFAAGDGSVRSVFSGIFVTTYQNLGHRADRGLIDDEY